MLGFLVAGLLVATSALGDRQVAFTFDDVPGAYLPNCNVDRFRALNTKLVAAIKRNSMPALGFVNGSRLCEEKRDQTKALLQIWLDGGLQLGSHTFRHPDFNNLSLADFEADIIANEKYLPQKPLYFRFPFLHQGTELAKKRAIEEFLAKRGYRNAVVTIDNDDYIYAAAYASAVRRGDTSSAKRLSVDYIRYMSTVFEFYEKLTPGMLGREIPHILLLHDNSLNADHLDALAKMVRGRGYRFISVDEAMRDPIYSRKENYIGGRGLSHVHRWAMEDGKNPPEPPGVPGWVMEQFRSR